MPRIIQKAIIIFCAAFHQILPEPVDRIARQRVQARKFLVWLIVTGQERKPYVFLAATFRDFLYCIGPVADPS